MSAEDSHSPYERREQEPSAPIEPNAPSSPQWSLSEHQSREHEVVGSAEPVAMSRHEQAAEADATEAVSDVESASSQPEEPREARKGWWQRRFKM